MVTDDSNSKSGRPMPNTQHLFATPMVALKCAVWLWPAGFGHKSAIQVRSSF